MAAVASLLLILAVCSTGPARVAQRPEDDGLSSARRCEITATFQSAVERRETLGTVVLIARNHLEAFGFREREASAQMSRDAIFRIGSMTKPVTTAAALMLVDGE